MAGKYVVKKAKNGQTYFNLKAGNGETILSSEMYKKRASAMNGIASVQKNSPDAKRYDTISYDEAIQKNLRVMDQPALALCRDNGLPIVVFDISVPGNIQKVAAGKKLGTRVGG